MIKYVFSIALIFAVSIAASAEELYVNSKMGNDANSGTRSLPLRTISEAARRVNGKPDKAGTTIILSGGVHVLTETVLFNNRKYTSDNRLVIRAELLPDDAGWNPQQMPILLMAVPTVVTPKDGEMAWGIEIETNHVTIEGLRFTGGSDFYYIDGRQNRRTYPIWRDGKDLDDLLISQCLFVGNVDVSRVRVGVIARGHGLVLDHCVFYGCENPVVFMDAEGGVSRRNAMRYCLVYGNNYTGMWTSEGTSEDLEFHHNIISDCPVGWMREGKRIYKVHDCIIANNISQCKDVANSVNTEKPTLSNFLEMQNVLTSGKIEIEKDPGKNNYLQLKAGSFGTDLKAGLFKN